LCDGASRNGCDATCKGRGGTFYDRKWWALYRSHVKRSATAVPHRPGGRWGPAWPEPATIPLPPVEAGAPVPIARRPPLVGPHPGFAGLAIAGQKTFAATGRKDALLFGGTRSIGCRCSRQRHCNDQEQQSCSRHAHQIFGGGLSTAAGEASGGRLAVSRTPARQAKDGGRYRD
jgi:hypothetical protein